MDSGPVFADSSGRRRRVMRYAGLGVAGVLAVCLCAVVVAMTGGPQAPFTHWAVQRPPQAASTGGASQQAKGHSPKPGRSGVVPAPGAGNPAPPSPGASPSASTGPSPTARPSATATHGATATASPRPTNPAGKTPPGHTKSPNPHKSRSAA